MKKTNRYSELSTEALGILQSGGVFVPSPLALSDKFEMLESWQRLLTLYYIRAGAKAVIPGAHTGEFAFNDLSLLDRWMNLVKEMTESHGSDMLLMAAIGGDNALKQAEAAARLDYDIVLIAPTAFSGKSIKEVLELLADIASVIPVFGFELQKAIPGSYTFSPKLWEGMFEFAYGAKGASFDTYRSLVMLEMAAKSSKRETLTMLTGNDDRIVSDLLGNYKFNKDSEEISVQYKGGLLGHYATDTHAAVNWTEHILNKRKSGLWSFPLSEIDLAHAVNRCNLVLFDALGNFENSVWGVKYRLTKLGLLPAPYCRDERGRKGQAVAIDSVYGSYPALSDSTFLQEHLENMKNEVGIKN